MAISVSSVDAILKEIVEPAVIDALPKTKTLYSEFEKNVDTVVFNNEFYAPLRSQRHSGVANLASDTSKLRTGADATTRANVGVKIMTGSFDITDLAMKASQGDKKAIVSELSRASKSLTEDFKKDINRQLNSDGVGVIAQVAGSASGTSVTVTYVDSSCDDGRVKNASGSVNGDISPTKYIIPGQILGVGTAGADTGTVHSVSGTTVNFTGALNSAANDAIYILDGDGAGAGTSEVQGIKAAINSDTSGTYAGVDRTTQTWTAQSGTAAGVLSISDMEDLYVSALEYMQDGDRYAWFMNKTLYRKFGDLLVAMRREPKNVQLKSGWSGLSFQMGAGEVGVFLDFDTPDGAAVLVNLDTWTVAQVADMSFINDFNRRDDYLTYQKVMVYYWNVLCKAPAANGILTNKTA